MIKAVALVSSILVAACATGTDVTFDDGADSPESGSSEGGASPAPSGASSSRGDAGTAPKGCVEKLSIGAVKAADSTCSSLNEHVHNTSISLAFPCAGGALSASFRGQVFTGTVTGSKLLLTAVASFSVNGCQLESTETIAGDLAAPPLTYAYNERFTGGTCTGLDTCTASAQVTSP